METLKLYIFFFFNNTHLSISQHFYKQFLALNLLQYFSVCDVSCQKKDFILVTSWGFSTSQVGHYKNNPPHKGKKNFFTFFFCVSHLADVHIKLLSIKELLMTICCTSWKTRSTLFLSVAKVT